MAFAIGKEYPTRDGRIARRIAGWGQLPTFELDGRTIVQAADGRYRFDGIDNPRDILLVSKPQD